MELSTFASESSKHVVSAEFKKTISLDGKRLTVELSPFCWAHKNKLSIDVSGFFGKGRFVSTKSFKTATLNDLDKLIKRVKKTKLCKKAKCKKKYLVHDFLKEKNPKGLCPTHLEKDIKVQQELDLKSTEKELEQLEGAEHDKVTSSGGVQDDESTQEAICAHAKSISAVLNKEMKTENLLRTIAKDNESQIVIGIADYLMKRKVSINKRGLNIISKHIEKELEPEQIADWVDQKNRKKDLKALLRKIKALKNKQ